MKKSKIIVPALALIAFSTAASITGTVAWFTASRQVTFNAGTYSITSTTQGLEYELSTGVATTAAGNKKSVSFNTNCKLTDGSFDHINKKFFAPNQTGDGVADPAGIALTDANLATKLVRGNDGTDTFYTAATFGLAVSLQFNATGDSHALYLDAANTTFSAASATGKAFRVAIVGIDSGVTTTKVVAKNDTAANSKHVDGTSTSTASSTFLSGVAYSGDLIDSLYSTALPSNNGDDRITMAAAEARTDYLGKFVFSPNQKVTLNFTVVVWYEGTHAEIKDANVEAGFENISVTLGLATVSCKAAS